VSNINSNIASNTPYDNTKNHREKSIGFGKSQKEDRVSIPNDPEWVAFKETLESTADFFPEYPPEQAKINAALIWYRSWLTLRPKPPKKGEKRIAQQICSDYFGVTRFEFVRTASALNNAVNRCSLEVAS
jgi:hypothetical protein